MGSLTRRSLFGGGFGTVLALPALGQSPIVFISRERVLREVAASRDLRAAEESMTGVLQSSIDAALEQLAGEEADLARLRATLPAAEFEQRASDFDRRIRLIRREAQNRASRLQAGFQQARSAIVVALPSLFERVRSDAGASMVVNADQALALDGSLDLTDRAIALFDAEGPRPPPPAVDLAAPLLAPEEQDVPDTETSDQ